MSQIPNFAKVGFADASASASAPSGDDWLTPEGIAVKPSYGPADVEGLGEHVADALRDLDRGCRVLEPGQHHRELVTAHTGDDVARTHAVPQALGDLHQELVATVVAVGVVDFLEAVEVQEEHGQRVADPAAPAHALELLVEAAPVGQDSGKGAASILPVVELTHAGGICKLDDPCLKFKPQPNSQSEGAREWRKHCERYETYY